MRRPQGHSLDWAGDMIPSPHGDWFHRDDVERLQDEITEALVTIVSLRAEISEPPPERPAATFDSPYRLFGWASPDDARAFNSGHKDSCRVYKKRTELFCMPLSNTLGPNHYQKPPVGAPVKIFEGRDAVVVGHVPEGLTVEAGGIQFNVEKWSWKR